ncbi:MAG: SufE family protein [Pseudomonadota bacterium]
MDIAEIVDNFELLGDWDARYAYLVELGVALSPMREEARVDANRVKPCMSQLWVHACEDPEMPGSIRYEGDCDTAVIKGVLALLIGLLSGRTADEIESMDLDDMFDRLKLAENLSPNRHVGIYAIVGQMKAQARALGQSSLPRQASMQ